MKKWIFGAVAVLVAACLLWLLSTSDDVYPERVDAGKQAKGETVSRPVFETTARPKPVKDGMAAQGKVTVRSELAEGEAKSEKSDNVAEADAEQDEDRRVDAFDALTDKWMEPAKKGVSMEDVGQFVRQFKALPAARKDECLHRALNLVPDENVMLLAGILMDKSIEKDCLELVFNDILNRDEDVKNPILRQVFADRTHPCYADAAWILDVTGEVKKH